MPILQFFSDIRAIFKLEHSDLHITGSLLRHSLPVVDRQSHKEHENPFALLVDFEHIVRFSTGKHLFESEDLAA